jgi:hypothetical protein
MHLMLLTHVAVLQIAFVTFLVFIFRPSLPLHLCFWPGIAKQIPS